MNENCMNAVQVRQELERYVNNLITVKSTIDSKIYKGYLQRHMAGWQIMFFADDKKQVIYFPTCVAEILGYHPFTIRLNNK